MSNQFEFPFFDKNGLTVTERNTINNLTTLHYQLLNTQTNNAHEQTMKRIQLEFDLKKIEIDLKKIEINRDIQMKELENRSKELDIENFKLKHNKK